MSIDLKFQDPKVLMRTNVDWSGPSLAHGKKVYDELLKREWVLNMGVSDSLDPTSPRNLLPPSQLDRASVSLLANSLSSVTPSFRRRLLPVYRMTEYGRALRAIASITKRRPRI
jgi:hypothetical protein